ncbi:hypothetical protein BDC45DRAFT_601687 [Circinella umbellata]|nr:hypothetical protein BDC45DRAFT_601687 [Circinella umbellata]
MDWFNSVTMEYNSNNKKAATKNIVNNRTINNESTISRTTAVESSAMESSLFEVITLQTFTDSSSSRSSSNNNLLEDVQNTCTFEYGINIIFASGERVRYSQRALSFAPSRRQTTTPTPTAECEATTPTSTPEREATTAPENENETWKINVKRAIIELRDKEKQHEEELARIKKKLDY